MGWSLTGCNIEDRIPAEPPPRVDAPVLTHTPPDGTFTAGDLLALSVDATDVDEIREVNLHFRVTGTEAYTRQPMLSDDGTTWRAELELTDPGVEYWFRGTDDSDFVVSTDLPSEAGDAPYTLVVAERAIPVPWAEDFEAATIEDGLHLIGWGESALDAPGFEWRLSELRAQSGRWAVQHRAGLGAPLDDWLISPALDLSAVPTAQVTWFEHGLDTARAAHSVWISTGSPDPRTSDWTKVADVPPPPEDAWARSALVDLTPWAGESLVRLAWRATGGPADLWTIDDVSVDLLGPDVQLLQFEATDLAPAAAGRVQLTLEALGAPLEEALVVTGSTAWQQEAFTQTISVDEAIGTFTIDEPLVLDPTTPDDSLISLTITATSGPHLWSWTETVLVGDPSLATVGFELDDLGFASFRVGTGPLDAPLSAGFAAAGVLDARAHTGTLDLTPDADLLPPGPGPARWWVTVETDITGHLTDFDIATNGMLYRGTDLGEFGPGKTTFYLPDRPDPIVVASTTNPKLTPGGTATWELTIDNAGGAFVGPTSLALDSEFLTVDPGPYVLGDDWQSTFSLAAEVGAPADHRDSTPLPVELTITDSLESLQTTAWVEVPWPVLEVSRVVIDATGNGLLDDGETAGMDITLVNTGDTRTTELTCTLAPVGTATASGEAQTGPLEPGASTVLTGFTVSGTGVAGTRVLLELTCIDRVDAWVIPIELFLSQPQWQWFTEVPDARGDNGDAYPFDFRWGRYRVVQDELQIELRSAVPYEPETLFVEVWMQSFGAEWELYQLVSQSGVASLRGYLLGSWWTLAPPRVVHLDEETFRLEIQLSGMNLASNTLELGFAAGWCGGSIYYCDHYPEGWGDPYQTYLNTSVWFDLSW